MKIKVLFASACIFALSLISIDGVPFAPTGEAEAQAMNRAGGFRAPPRMPPRGATTRPIQRPSAMPSRPSARPIARPSSDLSRPSTRPVMRPTQPTTRPINRPITRPTPVPDRPVARPPGDRPEAGRPPGNRPGVGRPPGNRPGLGRPPVYRPPISRPPGWRPPYYRPPLWRPPLWRPPYYRPPYYRPPHWMWGSYYWSPRWRWYFTVRLAASTLVFVDRLPDEEDDGPECSSAVMDGETIYICDGVLYRATYYEDEQVYEIVSEPDEMVNLDN